VVSGIAHRELVRRGRMVGLLAGLLTVVSAAGCDVAVSTAAPPAAPEVDATTDEVLAGRVVAEQVGRYEIVVDDRSLRVTTDGRSTVGWTLDADAGATFTGLSVRPGRWHDVAEAAVLVADGDRLRLSHLRVDAQGSGSLTPFADGLQPDAVGSGHRLRVDWTPDGRSLLWAEPTGAASELRVVEWSDVAGPVGTVAARLDLDVPADVHVGGFRSDDAGWTLLLRRAAEGDPFELPLTRDGDGRLVLAAAVSAPT
jgi:hypothetical protein